MEKCKKIGIVTVLYNSEPVLEDFINSLERQSYNDFVLYAVDNKSTDNSCLLLRNLLKDVSFDVVLIEQTENMGVANGNNVGIDRAIKDGVKYVLLSNNDVVLKNDAIEILLNGMLSHNATMAVPKIYYWGCENIIAAAGSRIRYLSCTTPEIGCKEEDKGQYDFNRELEMASTCFMLIDVGVFARVGKMNDLYFVYYDDTDFVWRAVIKGNEKLFYIFKSCIWHRISYTTGGALSKFSVYYSNRNRVFFALKYFKAINKILFCLYLIIHYMFKFRWKLNCDLRKIYIKSIKDGYRMYLKNNKKNF